MPFDPTKYGPEIAAVLALDSNGERLMALATPTSCSERARDRVGKLTAPPPVIGGLYLYFGCWKEAHETVDDSETPDGCYWHAIVHRQEPDAGNAGYWFRQVGAHPVFPALRERAAAIGVEFGAAWNATAFVDYCERARREPGSEMERKALEVQRAEWQLLFDHSMREFTR